LRDVFALQDEIAAAIVGTLRVTLVGQHAASRPYEPDLRAYEAFLKATPLLQTRLFLATWEEQGARAEEYLRQAIGHDPRWAAPHAALAQYHLYAAIDSRRRDMIALARAEARTALELLPSDPMAHAVLGQIAALHDYDWNEAGEQFALAMASERVSLSVHDVYAGCYLSPLGRFTEALHQTEQVIAHDPLNMLCRARQVRILVSAEMYERAIIESQTSLEFDERHNSAHSMIALAHYLLGTLAEAREWAEEAFRRTPSNPLAAGVLAGLLKRSGEIEHAATLLATLRGMAPLGMIICHVVCSEIDVAIDWYEQAIEQRHPYAVWWAAAGFLKPLRSNPRWLKLAAMMNLPPPR
jgi:adenylate cyclase